MRNFISVLESYFDQTSSLSIFAILHEVRCESINRLLTWTSFVFEKFFLDLLQMFLSLKVRLTISFTVVVTLLSYSANSFSTLLSLFLARTQNLTIGSVRFYRYVSKLKRVTYSLNGVHVLFLIIILIKV